MAVLEKKTTLFDRDEKGELVPQEVELIIDENDEDQLELKGSTIFVTPMTRGEIRRMFSNLKMSEKEERDLDGELIVEHCKKPSYTLEEVKVMKRHVASAIVNTIMFHSGLDVGLGKKKAVEKVEDDFGKN